MSEERLSDELYNSFNYVWINLCVQIPPVLFPPAGDMSVGKSSLLLRFVKGIFWGTGESTVGGKQYISTYNNFFLDKFYILIHKLHPVLPHTQLLS